MKYISIIGIKGEILSDGSNTERQGNCKRGPCCNWTMRAYSYQTRIRSRVNVSFREMQLL